MKNSNQTDRELSNTSAEEPTSNDAPLIVEVPSAVRAGLRFVATSESSCYSGSGCYSGGGAN